MLSQSPASHAVHANKMSLGLASTHKKNAARTRGRATFKSKSVAPTGDDKILEKLLKKNEGIGLKQDDMAAKIRDSLDEKDYSMHYLSPRCKAVDESSRLPQEKLDRVVREVNYMSKQLLADIQEKERRSKMAKNQEEAQAEEDDPVKTYYQALVAVTEPHFPPS